MVVVVVVVVVVGSFSLLQRLVRQKHVRTYIGLYSIISEKRGHVLELEICVKDCPRTHRE